MTCIVGVFFVWEGVRVGVLLEGIWQASEIRMRNITHALSLVAPHYSACMSTHPFCLGWKPRDPHNAPNVNNLAVAWIAVALNAARHCVNRPLRAGTVPSQLMSNGYSICGRL